MPTSLSRRTFVKTVLAAAPALVVPTVLWADTSRRLSFAHTHTGERLVVEYSRDGRYLTEGLEAINRVLRDFRTGDVHQIDPELMDLLHDLGREVGTARPFEVISGYRSPKTNAALREKSNGVAAGSLHMRGQAIDVRLADVPLRRLRDAALDLGRGGVGFYPGSNFVHVDTGRVRQW